MDEMKINSHFTTGIISRLIEKKLTKLIGFDIDINIKELDATINEGKIQLHIDMDANADKTILLKVLE